MVLRKYGINPSLLFFGFYLLMEEEKASGKKKDLLYKRVLGETLDSKQFKAMYENFRKAFETKDVRFHDTYQWFEGEDSIVFAGSPKRYEERSRFFRAIEPKFILTGNGLFVELGCGEACVAGTDGNSFYTSQCCYPINLWEFPIEKLSKSKLYAERLLNATKVALESFTWETSKTKKYRPCHCMCLFLFYKFIDYIRCSCSSNLHPNHL